MSTNSCILFAALMSISLHYSTGTSTVRLESHNIDDILNHNELVLVNFYADWCRFSQMLKPVYESAAAKVAEEFPRSGSVVLGSVDCDRETGIAQRYQVTKYPTLKLFRNGQQIKREYRGQRSAEAMSNFIREQMKDPVVKSDHISAVDELDTKKRHIIGYFDSDDGGDYDTFRRVGSLLRDDCQFHAVIGTAAEPERIQGNKMMFRPPGELATDMLYTGPLQDYNLMLKWVTDKCVPLVREITFENAEELTEEGLPFMILFHHVDDNDTPEKFKNVVAREMLTEKSAINFLLADGEKFTHPLHHLGKTSKDLPILAIDSFRHMYIWNHDPKTSLETPGMLKEFVSDLQSGKLHREFHHGPDPLKATPSPDGNDSNETGLATKDEDNVVHFNIQQQLIINANGVRMTVIKFIPFGHDEQVDLREHLSAIEFGSLGNLNIPEGINLDDKEKSKNSVGNFYPVPNGENIEEHDQTTSSEQEARSITRVSKVQMKIVDGSYEEDKRSPPNSIFRKLAPSRERYTILNGREEL